LIHHRCGRVAVRAILTAALAGASVPASAQAPRLDANGYDCLRDIAGHAERRPGGIYEHQVSVTNGCPEPIYLRACYTQTRICIVLVARANGRTIGVLGRQRDMPQFTFDFVELDQPAPRPSR
jgi:hypothetical protein